MWKLYYKHQLLQQWFVVKCWTPRLVDQFLKVVCDAGEPTKFFTLEEVEFYAEFQANELS